MRNKDGTFKRTRTIWTPENWDNGYIDNKGRFRVYRPDCPRAFDDGYALRAHVVWWLHFGESHPQNKELHHIDHIKTHDTIDNLIPLTNSEHQRIHTERLVTLICENCKNPFKVKEWRAKSRPTRFCSQKCYHAHKRTDEHRQRISDGLKRAYRLGHR